MHRVIQSRCFTSLNVALQRVDPASARGFFSLKSRNDLKSIASVKRLFKRPSMARAAATAIAIVSAFACGGPALAWGSDGHKTVALIAEAQLTPMARTGIQALLSLEPGATLASISTWADEHRSPTTAAWHYVNFARGDCVYDSERDCPDGKCVVGAIERQTKVLQAASTPDERLGALKYLVHFVADVHQPLHAGYADDKGGNQYQLQAFMRGSNLHALWDSGLIKNLNEVPEILAARLQRSSAAVPAAELDSVIAAQESCSIVSLPDYYPERRVGMDYINRFTPVAEQRLATAGARLAGLLNRIFR